ncbi:cobalamin B12-binding domain-containing protein [Paenibacillus sp. JX-17]|uniref:Cobalamin B12-binding domain-containing protein n=1 Tax=Paenibacillus lacisoli TaxID=3064525 RepID=A0ABT9CFW5_9BACL|nr:cobalamin B12-binding domain-containing protein [Paenibacillus sp. JX-17]MDO7906493.1 cobalamin B12-binding domain-containing protein [Paenibacillus sp. JX-17]
MYSIKQVSAMLDIPTVTLRAWENRYQAVVPNRSSSGYRSYSDQDVEDLRWLKSQVESGMSISHAVRQLRQQREEEASSLTSIMGETGVASAEGYAKMTDQLYQTLFHFQAERANTLIDFGFTMFGYDAMFYHVLVPVLIRVGDAWENGRASVAQEHFMTQLISQRFYQFFHLFPIYPQLPKVLALCPEGEHHQVGLLLFALFLRKNGLEVLYLGANTPLDGVLELIRDQGINMVCTSVTNKALVEKNDHLVDEISSRFPKIRFVLGGKAYEDDSTTRHRKWMMKMPAEEWQSWFEREYLVQ